MGEKTRVIFFYSYFLEREQIFNLHLCIHSFEGKVFSFVSSVKDVGSLVMEVLFRYFFNPNFGQVLV